jgi:hypothetical protein
LREIRDESDKVEYGVRVEPVATGFAVSPAGPGRPADEEDKGPR